MTYLVVGAGFTGATIAERLASAGEEVLVVERRARVGGSAEDYRAEDGLLIQKYGPHVFHTNSEKVWQYVQRFGDWRAIRYKVAANVGGELYPLPLGLSTFDRLAGSGKALLPPELPAGLSEVAMGLLSAMGTASKTTLIERYGLGARIGIMQLRRDFPAFADWAIERVFRGYNEKHWGMPLEEVPASVLARLPFVVGEQDSYFTDKYQAVPIEGYTAIVERMLDHPKIKVVLNMDAAEIARASIQSTARRVIWTGSPDAFFGEAGALPYRSVHFDVSKRGLRGGWEMFHTVTNPEHDGPTRATNMALMNGREDSADAIIVTDYPRAYVTGKNDPFYPIPLEPNIRRAQEYAARAPKNVWFAGRLGSYTYLNMDQAIAQALALSERIRAA